MSKQNRHKNHQFSGFGDSKNDQKQPKRVWTVEELISGKANRYHDDDDDNDRKHKSYDDEDDYKESKHKNHSRWDDDDDDYEDRHHDKHNEGNIWKQINPDRHMSHDEIVKVLVKGDGLNKILKDLKKNGQNASQQMQRCLRDVTFASALTEAIAKTVGDEYDEDDLYAESIDYLLKEINVFLNNSYKSEMRNMNGEVLDAVRSSYSKIIFSYSHDKAKKLEDKFNLDSATTNKLILITAGNDPSTSIYSLLKYMYTAANDGELDYIMSSNEEKIQKNVLKLIKACYGKKKMDDAIKALMLERKRTQEEGSEAENLSVNITMAIYMYLEELERKDIEDIILSYVSQRKKQESNGSIPRRFGNRKAISEDDYPNLVKAIDKLEKRQFDIIKYLRNE